MAIGSSSKSKSSNNYSDAGSKQQGGRSTFLFKVLNFAIWGICGAVILTNIKPYEQLAGMYFSRLDYSYLGDALVAIPIVGLFFSLLFRFANLTAGTLLWIFVQALELIPTELMGHEQFLDKNIQRANRNNYQKDSRDSWEVKVAKRMRNSVSTEVLRFLILLGALTYIADFFLCLTIFPPVQGGGNIWQLLDAISLQRWSVIDWGNILQAATTVGAVQFLLKLRKIIVRVIQDIA
ncbi:MAG: hypothetical protein HC815_30825 [Richelia sp. RM1_1_1]|nr:hypothetical protein [Richelia sp. RM1_1_1]